MTERNKDDQIPTSETEGKQPFGEQTGENEGGFVATKKEDESGYVQGERKSESDIEGSSIKKDDQTS